MFNGISVLVDSLINTDNHRSTTNDKVSRIFHFSESKESINLVITEDQSEARAITNNTTI